MRYKPLIKTLVLALFAMALTGCFSDNDLVYDGPLQVEFRPTSDSQRMSNGTSYTANIQLIGPHQSRPITIDFVVDTENSTAVEGTHFTLGNQQATIPANSSFGEIVVNAIEENIDSSRPVVHITLLDSDGVIAAHNYKTLVLTLRP